jgi:hypothetical protein
MRRAGLGVLAAIAVVAAMVLATVVAMLPGATPAHAAPSLGVFRQLGAWVDVFDYAPRLQRPGEEPKVRPASIGDMAALGVKTLYVQVANPDGAPADQLTDREELRALLARAHEHGMAVVPWFLPRLVEPSDDIATMREILALRADGESFDAIGLDLESGEVPDIDLRNRRTVAFTSKVRKLVGSSVPLAAIVYPAVQLEVLNTTLWPDFPYRAVDRSVDLWMPMSYYTYRSAESGLRNAYRYTVDSVDRLRRRVGDDDVPVHLIGGLADESTPDDYFDMERAARTTHALGWSVYDFATTPSWSWPYLRGTVPVPTTSVPPTTAPPATTPRSTSTSSTTTTTTTTTTTAAPTTSTTAARAP